MEPRIPEVLNLVSNIRHFYLEKGLTASGLAKKAGLDPSFFNKLERDPKGWSDMRLSSIMAIANALDISLVQLVYREDFSKRNYIQVPTIPTEKMLLAGENAMSCIPPWPAQEVEDIWKAMIGAAEC